MLGLGAVLYFATMVFDLGISLTPVILVAVIVLLYNIGFFLLHRLVREKSGYETTARGLRIEANFQIGLDLLALILLVHYTGGIENPFIFFFVFHMILGSLLLTGRDIWIQAAAALGILFILLALSHFNIIDRYSIGGFVSADLRESIPYIWAGVISFSATIFLSVYMTNSISRSLRRREEELFFTKNLVEIKSRELEQANQELIRHQNLLVQTEKLTSLGKLSAGVAHELNNPLTGILSFSHFIKDSHSDDAQLQRDIDVVIRETDRCKKIIKGLLDFARQSQPEKNLNDMLQLLKETVLLVKSHRDFKDIEIKEDLPDCLPLIMFDKDQMKQVFMNLFMNAADAMLSGGTLYIGARQADDNDYIEVKITDTGVGIDEDVMRNIFDPFFTTKDKGTGLGLSISLGIVESHGGRLEVKSSEGEGTTFTVNIPVSSEGIE